MDLAAGARRLVVLQTHVSKDGKSKLVPALTLPATALRCAHRVITELGVFDPAGDHFVCVEAAPGVAEEQIAQEHRRAGGVPASGISAAPCPPCPPARTAATTPCWTSGWSARPTA